MEDNRKETYNERIANKKPTPVWLQKYILTPLNWIISIIVILSALIWAIQYFSG